ncbi:MAG TPA: lamin tail domain-containing protein [Candidatus Nanoarchaeia archaeon]|nr:lamin tail domain-containing protein [Candidatus Nanoarchaeia archaeon]
MKLNQLTWMLGVLLIAQPCLADVVINQVLVDPIGTESGGESVELLNNGDEAVNISGWILRTQSSATDAIVPSGTFLQANSHYLIADNGWSSLRDDPTWRLADTEQSITLKNSDSGIALYSGSERIDALGWGSIGDSNLFIGQPAANPSAGKSLRRVNNTGDNSIDFAVSEAEFFGGAGKESQIIHVELIVENHELSIGDPVLPDDEPENSGIQLLPGLGRARELRLQVPVVATGSPELVATFAGTTIVLTRDSNTSYSGTLSLSPELAPVTHDLRISATDSQETVTKNVPITILGVIGFALSATTLSFDANSSRHSVTVTNLGNVALDLGITGTDLRNSDTAIPATAVSVSYTPIDESSQVRALSSLVELLNLDIAPRSNTTLGLFVEVPHGVRHGIYAGSISLVGVGN